MDHQKTLNQSERQMSESTEAKSPLKKAPPRYWETIEQYEGLAVETGEFMTTPVREGHAASEDSPQHQLERREFFQIMGAGLALAATGCTRRPIEKIVPYLNQPAEVTPGVPNFYASTCGECSASCGVLVKTREGKPIKLEGNPEHPLSQGGLCARGQASILNLYDPDRLQAPLVIDRSTHVSTATNWDQIDLAISAELKKFRGTGGRVRLLTGELSGSTQKLAQEFTALFSDGKHVSYEPTSEEETALGQEESYGNRVLPQYHFDKAKTVVSFGADFLGTWGSVVENQKGFSKARKVDAGKHMAQLVVFEPVMSLTGSNADIRSTVRAGDQLKVALAIAHEIIITRKISRFAVDGDVINALNGFSVTQVASVTGVDAKAIKAAAEALIESRGTGIVLGGGASAKGDLGVALEAVVNLLNSALENEGSIIHGSAHASPVNSSFLAFAKLIEDMKAGHVDALLIHADVNPVLFASALGFEEALKKVPLVVSFARALDETAFESHFVCSDHHYLENWGDAHPSGNIHSLVQPTIYPLYKTRAFQDSLLTWSKAVGGVVSHQSWYDYLRAQWQGVQHDVGASGSFGLFWDNALRVGVVGTSGGAASPRNFKTASLKGAVQMAAVANNGMRLVVYPKISMGDGRSGNNSWLQELPDPVTKITWDNYASVSASYAKKMGLKEGDIVRIKSGTAAIELPTHVQPGNHADVVAIAMGYGRVRAGRVGNGVGQNVFPLVKAGRSVLSFTGIDVSLEKTSGIRKLACTQGHHSMEGRAIIKEASLQEFKKNPAAGNEKEAEALVTLWPTHKYDGHRWAMSIDLSACTGCGACVVGCQAENNIPVVGYKDVLNGREMHWIRIDRYYSTDPEKDGADNLKALDNPKTAYQPMLCQHCENAPCETVCPVLATTHDDEGLNQQTYNRCVGTRYCMNNCPYKVRRFNWFTYTEVASPQNFQYNPDVTVRTRGVMEKCTFCTHRIQDAKGRAKDMGRKILDGELKTACQQSCPSDAISFGDINDKKSRVAQLSETPRSYHVLEELNVRPSVSYLTKIRNSAEER